MMLGASVNYTVYKKVWVSGGGGEINNIQKLIIESYLVFKRLINESE